MSDFDWTSDDDLSDWSVVNEGSLETTSSDHWLDPAELDIGETPSLTTPQLSYTNMSQETPIPMYLPIKANANTLSSAGTTVSSSNTDDSFDISTTNHRKTPVEVNLPCLMSLNQEINNLINQRVIKHLERILIKIAKDRRLNVHELKDKYLFPLKEVAQEIAQTPLNTKSKNVSDTNSNIQIDNCQALIANGRQCSKKQLKNKPGPFCGIHQTKQPYGIVKTLSDAPNPTNPTKSVTQPLTSPVITREPVKELKKVVIVKRNRKNPVKQI